jgi:FAD/FMN-containing dehydrogenase
VGYVINIGAAWEEGPDEPRIAWARTLDAAIRPSSVGVYVNFLTAEEGADRVRAAYPPAVWERLRTIKRQWDPANVFRLNENIPPGQRGLIAIR